MASKVFRGHQPQLQLQLRTRLPQAATDPLHRVKYWGHPAQPNHLPTPPAPAARRGAAMLGWVEGEWRDPCRGSSGSSEETCGERQEEVSSECANG